ncbi:MAG: methyltransferase [Aquificaceae bacterium]|nr:methyltransferase [Aquificaceae bacterium]
MEEYREFDFFRGKVRFRQPRSHRLSVVEILFLANLRGVRKSSKVVDLGAGFGALSIILALKHQCQVWAIERDPKMLELLKHNLVLNGLEEKVHVVEMDLKDVWRAFRPHHFDVIVANPPFYKGRNEKNTHHHEADTTLEDFIKAGGFLLRDGGSFNLLMASGRLIEAILYMEKYNIHTASIRFFYPKITKNSKVVCIYALKNLKPNPVVEKPLIINEEDGSFTQEARDILDGFL